MAQSGAPGLEPIRSIGPIGRIGQMGRRGGLAPYIFLAPTLVLMLVFIFYPMLRVFYYSLRTDDLTQPYLNGFIGLKNFVTILTKDPLFWSSLSITGRWVVSEVVLQLCLGLGLALILNRAFKFRGLYRAVVFAPWAVSGVLITAIWSLLLNPFSGPVDDLLKKLGLIHASIGFTSDPKTVFWSVVVAELWRGIPFFTIMLLAALQSIPGEFYESARVDGAGRWRMFVSMTLPQLKDAIVLSTLLRAVWEFNNVDMIYTMTDGGPANLTTTLPVYIMNEAVNAQNFGYGSALTIIGFFILMLFALIYLKLSRFGEGEL